MALSPEEWKPHPAVPQQPREKPMRVLCLGLSRTSTMSLYFALNRLGYNSYHYVESSLNMRNGAAANWHKALNAKYFGEGKPYAGKDFEKMLWRYDAVTDIPAVLFADELLAAYPDAKVVLTTRDPDGWLRSIEASFFEILSWKGWKPLGLFDHVGRPIAALTSLTSQTITRHHIALLRGALQVWSNNDWQNRAKLKEGFVKHNAHIRKIVPKERLLEYHSSQGWGPLCEFLDQPIPAEPYPKINEGSFAADLNVTLFYRCVMLVCIKGALYASPLAIAAGIAWWLNRQA